MLSKRVRITLFILGILIILCSLGALISSLSPSERVRDRQTIVPTLLTPPGNLP